MTPTIDYPQPRFAPDVPGQLTSTYLERIDACDAALRWFRGTFTHSHARGVPIARVEAAFLRGLDLTDSRRDPPEPEWISYLAENRCPTVAYDWAQLALSWLQIDYPALADVGPITPATLETVTNHAVALSKTQPPYAGYGVTAYARWARICHYLRGGAGMLIYLADTVAAMAHAFDPARGERAMLAALTARIAAEKETP